MSEDEPNVLNIEIVKALKLLLNALLVSTYLPSISKSKEFMSSSEGLRNAEKAPSLVPALHNEILRTGFEEIKLILFPLQIFPIF
jgi:hypothetical protein